MSSLSKKVIVFLVALLPWSVSLYLHYWFEQEQIWAPETPFRALISVVMLAVGMFMSFILYNWLATKFTR